MRRLYPYINLPLAAVCAVFFVVTPAPASARLSGSVLSPDAMTAPDDEAYQPFVLQGLRIYPDHPLMFDFLFAPGTGQPGPREVRETSPRLIKYFLAALTLPEEDLWVNLSPHERDRIIPQSFSLTMMGRDLLQEDYFLKQLTSSLLYPDSPSGKQLWERVYAEMHQRYGSVNLPVETYHKIWIVPDTAEIHQHNGIATIASSRLKVMLEQDLLALQKEALQGRGPVRDNAEAFNEITARRLRETLLPIIEQEVNEGKQFAALRQIYHSLILATWFKRHLKASLLGEVYVDRGKIRGIDDVDAGNKDRLYEEYLTLFKEGVSRMVREEYDPATNSLIQRKYFTGGMSFNFDSATLVTRNVDAASLSGLIKSALVATVLLTMPGDSVTDFSNPDLFDEITMSDVLEGDLPEQLTASEDSWFPERLVAPGAEAATEGGNFTLTETAGNADSFALQTADGTQRRFVALQQPEGEGPVILEMLSASDPANPTSIADAVDTPVTEEGIPFLDTAAAMEAAELKELRQALLAEGPQTYEGLFQLVLDGQRTFPPLSITEGEEGPPSITEADLLRAAVSTQAAIPERKPIRIVPLARPDIPQFPLPVVRPAPLSGDVRLAAGLEDVPTPLARPAPQEQVSESEAAGLSSERLIPPEALGAAEPEALTDPALAETFAGPVDPVRSVLNGEGELGSFFRETAEILEGDSARRQNEQLLPKIIAIAQRMQPLDLEMILFGRDEMMTPVLEDLGGDRFGLLPEYVTLALAMAFQESSFGIAGTSPAGARGIYQMLPSTARRLLAELKARGIVDPNEVLNLNNRQQNALLAHAYLAENAEAMFPYFSGAVVPSHFTNAAPGQEADVMNALRGQGVIGPRSQVVSLPDEESLALPDGVNRGRVYTVLERVRATAELVTPDVSQGLLVMSHNAGFDPRLVDWENRSPGEEYYLNNVLYAFEGDTMTVPYVQTRNTESVRFVQRVAELSDALLALMPSLAEQTDPVAAFEEFRARVELVSYLQQMQSPSLAPVTPPTASEWVDAFYGDLPSGEREIAETRMGRALMAWRIQNNPNIPSGIADILLADLSREGDVPLAGIVNFIDVLDSNVPDPRSARGVLEILTEWTGVEEGEKYRAASAWTLLARRNLSEDFETAFLAGLRSGQVRYSEVSVFLNAATRDGVSLARLEEAFLSRPLPPLPRPEARQGPEPFDAASRASNVGGINFNPDLIGFEIHDNGSMTIGRFDREAYLGDGPVEGFRPMILRYARIVDTSAPLGRAITE